MYPFCCDHLVLIVSGTNVFKNMNLPVWMSQFEASNNCSYVVSIREQIFGRILCFWILQIKNLLVSLAGRIFDDHYMKEGLLMKQIMFITLAAQDEIASYAINSVNGEINEISRMHVSGRPAPVTVDTKNRVLFVGRRDIPLVSSFTFDEMGTLTSLSDGPELAGDPCYISLDNTGEFLFGAYYNAGAASVHRLSQGKVEGESQWIKTGNGAHCIMTDRDNSFILLPHIAGERGLNSIRLFKFDEQEGVLIDNDPNECKQVVGRGPRHYVYHPNNKFVYFSNEQESSVTAYEYFSGQISEIDTKGTLPEQYSGNNTCAQIRMTPNGEYLYAPNRGHDSIAIYSVSNTTGKLTSVGRVRTEPTPRVLNIDLSGQYLYSAGLDSGYVSLFKILKNGNLEFVDRYEVGSEPMWIEIVNIED